MTIQFNDPILFRTMYTVLINDLSDCWMNKATRTGIFILPDQPSLGDVIINEILYDPYTGGSDWIEVYNNSAGWIDLKNWSLANYDNDTIGNEKFIAEHFYLKPGHYAVLSKDSVFIKQNYPSSNTGTFVYSETPSFDNDSSTVFLIYNGQVMDHVSYSEDWHFALLDNTEGISLERIDPFGLSNHASNWHSAAEAVGYATPEDKILNTDLQCQMVNFPSQQKPFHLTTMGLKMCFK